MYDLFIQTTLQYAISILPWVVLGIVLAYYLENHIKPKTIHKYLGSFRGSSMVTSIILGMISPLSIMSFLPVANEFISLGAHPGILFGFLIAERAYDLQSFFILSSLFGIKFAVLNAMVIFVSLYVSISVLKFEKIQFNFDRKKQHNHFWQRQLRLLLIVIAGIFLSAVFRTIIPSASFKESMGTTIGGIIGGLSSGFLLYLGPIIANYPVAKAFMDLGMSSIGVFIFLTVSPIINVVIISLFGGAVGYRITLKSFIIYFLVSFSLTLVLIPLLR